VAPIVIYHGRAEALRYMFIILLIAIPCECHLSELEQSCIVL